MRLALVGLAFILWLPEHLASQHLAASQVPQWQPDVVLRVTTPGLNRPQDPQVRDRSSQGIFILTGALIGGTLSLVTIGRALPEAEVVSEELGYVLAFAGGALVGAGIGWMVHEIAHPRR